MSRQEHMNDHDPLQGCGLMIYAAVADIAIIAALTIVLGWKGLALGVVATFAMIVLMFVTLREDDGG